MCRVAHAKCDKRSRTSHPLTRHTAHHTPRAASQTKVARTADSRDRDRENDERSLSSLTLTSPYPYTVDSGDRRDRDRENDERSPSSLTSPYRLIQSKVAVETAEIETERRAIALLPNPPLPQYSRQPVEESSSVCLWAHMRRGGAAYARGRLPARCAQSHRPEVPPWE